MLSGVVLSVLRVERASYSNNLQRGKDHAGFDLNAKLFARRRWECDHC